jgi:hypothetical protein
MGSRPHSAMGMYVQESKGGGGAQVILSLDVRSSPLFGPYDEYDAEKSFRPSNRRAMRAPGARA